MGVLVAVLSLVGFGQGVPARAVELSATLGGKPYGKVTYVRGLVPGTGMRRSLSLTVEDGETKYRIDEERTFGPGGVPLGIVRTYREGERTVKVQVTFEEKKAIVTYTEDDVSDTDEHVLSVENSAINDPSQFWFFGSVPTEKSESRFWEFSIDENGWVERKVKYEGVASLKIGEKTVQSHRISIGSDVNFYVDEHGMPYKSVQKTGSGDLVLVRTLPEVSP